MKILLTIIIFIAGLCLVICIHELGHLAMAKLFNVYCEEFSIGFGPKLIHINPKDKKTKKPLWETSINIRAIPLGGFVAMVGEEDDAALTDPDTPKVPKERTFSGVNHGKQAIIMVAGITMNVILSFFLFFFANFFTKQQDLYTNKVLVTDTYRYNTKNAQTGKNEIKEEETIFKQLGVANGDKIQYLSVDISEKDIVFVYEKNDEIVELTPDQMENIKKIPGIHYQTKAVLEGNEVNSVSINRALTNTIYSITDTGYRYYDKDGNVVNTQNQNNLSKIIYYLPKDESATLHIQVKYLTKKSNYDESKVQDVTKDIKAIDRISHAFFPPMGVNVYMAYAPFVAPNGQFIEGYDNMSWGSFGNAIAKSFLDQGSGISSVYRAIGGLFTPSGWQNVGGIISIFTTTEQAVDLGAYYVLWIWGMISINLAVMNLLPIPGLDGWQLFICIVESITRKKISKKFKTIASLSGFAVLGLFAIALIILDIVRLVV